MADGCACALQLAQLGIDVSAGEDAARDQLDELGTSDRIDPRLNPYASGGRWKPTDEELAWMIQCAARPWLLECLRGPPGSPGRKRFDAAAELVVGGAVIYALLRWG
ncbi:MAG: hypothetical protein ACRCU1_15240 [Alsobacter sp.]